MDKILLYLIPALRGFVIKLPKPLVMGIGFLLAGALALTHWKFPGVISDKLADTAYGFITGVCGFTVWGPDDPHPDDVRALPLPTKAEVAAVTANAADELTRIK